MYNSTVSLILSIILGAVTIQCLTTTATNFAQLSAIQADQSSRYTACSQHLLTCQPTISSCAAFVCATCTGLGQRIFNSCCSNNDPAPTGCFLAGLSLSGPNVYPAGATTAPALSSPGPNGPMTNNGFQACASISAYSSICESFSPGFTTTTIFELQAPCLCYQNTSWAPDIYDGFVQTCQSYLGPATSVIASITSTPCRNVGDVQASLSSYLSKSGQTTSNGPSSTSSSTSSSPSSSTRLPSPTASSAANLSKSWVRFLFSCYLRKRESR